MRPSDTFDRIGNVILASHQREAVSRIRDAFAEFGGALLCDVVGSGKTYIGLAIAHSLKSPLIVAPAALREMWGTAMRAADVFVPFVSIESLSRGTPDVGSADGLIVDEAHHFRNGATLRHSSLAALTGGRPILLMTATPIHNSRADLETLASLFLGARAKNLSESELARLIIRRQKDRIVISSPIPDVRPTEWLTIGDDPEIAGALVSLPPPAPLRGSGAAESLASYGLIRQWASSEAALRAAVNRRLARAIALEFSLEAGEYPSEHELRTWITGEDSIQLGFAGLVPPIAGGDSQELLAAVRSHAASLRELANILSSRGKMDEERAHALRLIVIEHPNARIIAFASYEATVTRLFDLLNRSCRVAALSSHGGRVAGGRLTRSEVIEQFDPASHPPSATNRIDLLLTTDLLSEGVNLQTASVVVHIDLPWTSARIEQRIGRIARTGSTHSSVRVLGFRPPESAEKILRGSGLVSAKWRTAAATLGTERDHRLASTLPITRPAPPEALEASRAILEGWRCHTLMRDSVPGVVGAALSTHRGFIGVVERAAVITVVACNDAHVSDSPAEVFSALAAADGPDARLDSAEAQSAIVQITDWMTARESDLTAGLGSSSFLRARRRILTRIDSLALRTPPHIRPRRGGLIDRARRNATSILGSAGEERIQSLAKEAAIADDEWLERVAELASRKENADAGDGTPKVRALLLLVEATPPPSS